MSNGGVQCTAVSSGNKILDCPCCEATCRSLGFFGIPVRTLSDKQSPRPAKLAGLHERTLPMSEPHLEAIGVMSYSIKDLTLILVDNVLTFC